MSVFKSNLPVHTYPDSRSVRQLICNKAIFGSTKILSPVCFTVKIVKSSTIFHSFNLFTASNPSVLHGKKLQNVKPPFGVIEVYSNPSYNDGQTCWDTFIKCPPFEQWTYLFPSPVYSHPSLLNQCCVLDPQVFLLLQTTLIRGWGGFTVFK